MSHRATFLETRVSLRPPVVRDHLDSMHAEGGDGMAYTPRKPTDHRGPGPDATGNF